MHLANSQMDDDRDRNIEGPVHETVIVGGGITGLACAERLHQRDQDFILLTRDLGGRVNESEAGPVNMGASAVYGNSNHVNRHYRLVEKISMVEARFHEQDRSFGTFNVRSACRCLVAVSKLTALLITFNSKVREFRRDTEFISQKQAIERDSYLSDLYGESATHFVRRHGLDRLHDTYLSKQLFATTYCEIDALNAFRYLQLFLPILNQLYFFSFSPSKVAEPFQQRVYYGGADRVRPWLDKGWEVVSDGKTYRGKNLVLATGNQWAIQQAGLDAVLSQRHPYVFHVAGKPKARIAGKRYHLFDPGGDICCIMHAENGQQVLYSTRPDPPLDEYYEAPTILARRHWFGNVHTSALVDAEPQPGLFLVGGDFNVFYMEENVITGLFAANRICGLA